MFTFLLTLLIVDALVLLTVVLLQAGKGGGLAAMGGGGGGSDSLFGGRQAATLLTRMSWWCGGAFMFLAFCLSILSSRPAGSSSILQEEFQKGGRTTPAPTAPALPGTQQGPLGAPANGAPATGTPNPLTGNAPATGAAPAPATGTTPPPGGGRHPGTGDDAAAVSADAAWPRRPPPGTPGGGRSPFHPWTFVPAPKGEWNLLPRHRERPGTRNVGSLGL